MRFVIQMIHSPQYAPMMHLRRASQYLETGWQPLLHITVFDETSNDLVAAMPLYIKNHSYGEYIFDWSCTQACQQVGIFTIPNCVVLFHLHPHRETDFYLIERHHPITSNFYLRDS